MTNVYCFCCFGTHDLAVNLTENSDFQNLDKDPTLLPTLNFFYSLLPETLGKSDSWGRRKKSRGWGKVLMSNS